MESRVTQTPVLHARLPWLFKRHFCVITTVTVEVENMRKREVLYELVDAKNSLGRFTFFFFTQMGASACFIATG